MPTVLITGANRGIGYGFARAYAKAGWRVIATCREPEKANDLKGLKGDIEIHELDVTDHGAADALAKKLKDVAIDVLINNAGVLGSDVFERGGPGQRLGDMDYKGFRETLEVNTLGPLKVTEAFLPHIENSGQKKLVTISTAMGSLATMEPGFIAYRASKTGVNAVMRNLAVTLREKGVIVAMLHPGWVRTDMGSQEAPLSIEESIAGMIDVIEGLTLPATGCYRNFKGETIPW